MQDRNLPETLSLFAERLRGAGVAVSRIVLGRGLAHPVVALASHIWDAEQPDVTVQYTPVNKLSLSELSKTPFGHLILNGQALLSARLTDPSIARRFDLFETLAAQGVTHYVALHRSFGLPDQPPVKDQTEFRGVLIAYCTHRSTGFTEAEIDGLTRVMSAMCLCIRIATDRVLVTELMDRYLGRVSGKRVLTGQSVRGDGTSIDCVLFYSDMRNSVSLSRALPMDRFLTTLNQYFDCTAGAVLDHGGEVLKFIGDGVLAIFPIDSESRPAEAMCAAALQTARESFARADLHDHDCKENGVPPMSFGIALHVGQVLYGNVGTEKRLDFTATGPAVGLVSRCESLTRSLGEPLLTTQTFADLCAEPGRSLGQHRIRGFQDDIDLVAYDP